MKEKIFISVLLLFGMFVNAQIVNIPDANFKAKLLSAATNNTTASNSVGEFMKIDSNENNEIELIEAQAVWKLYLDYSDISSLEGISAFTNLRELSCSNNDIQNLDLSDLLLLTDLLIINDYDLDTITLGSKQFLQNIDAEGSSLDSIDLSNMPSLKELNLHLNGMSSLSLSGCPLLETLKVGHNYFATLDLSTCVNLKYIDCSFNGMDMIDLSTCPNLTSVGCSYNDFVELDLTNLTLLKSLACGHNELTELNVSQNILLKTLNCEFNHFVQLDFSSCPALNSLNVFGNPLTSINLKNGTFPYVDSTAYQISTITGELYICMDTSKADIVYQNLALYGLSNIEDLYINDYCSFSPEENHNTVAGQILYDTDNNGCTTGDTIGRYIKINLNDENAFYTSTQGNYNIFLQTGSYTLIPEFNNDWFTVNPSQAVISFSGVNNSTFTQNFCMTANGIHPDAEVIILPVGNANPGFDAEYKIIYKNNGNQVLSGTVNLNYNDGVLDFVSAIPMLSSQSAGVIQWNYFDLAPFEERVIYFNLNINSPTETPAVNIGDMLNFNVGITPSENDETPGDNSFEYNQILTGSFDPNNIICIEGENVDPSKIGDYLHYTINFENTGTDEAIFIVVENEINNEQFDINSLKILNATHNLQTEIFGNKAKFKFNAIHLPAGGKGALDFKIKTLNSLAINDDVNQKANIYFDYNWPIETNDATTVFAILTNDNFQKDASVKVYPNPALSVINLTAASEIQSVQLYDAQGRVLETIILGGGTSVVVDVSSRASGLYFVKVITEQGSKVEKILKK